MGLSCCYAGEMHCLDAPFRLTTWANYITPALASPRVATDGVKLMGVQIPLSIIAMPLRRAYALPGAIFLVSA